MAVFTELTQTEIADCIAPYGLILQRYEGIAEGTQNTLYRVTSHNKPYVLTLFEGALTNKAYISWFINLHSQLAAKGFPCPAPLKDNNGDMLRLWNNNRPYCVFPFINGTHPTPTLAQAQAIGAALAQLHEIQPIVPHMENSWGVSAMQQIAYKLNGSKWAETLSAARAILGTVKTSHLPRGLIHADLFPDNALFENNTLNAIFDFFFACHDAYAYDLAITLSAWSFNSQNEHLPEIENAILQGYQQVRPLTTDEQQALPQLLELACIRFFLSRLKTYEAAVPQKMGALRDPGVYAARLKHYQEQAQ